jgi:DNA-binding NarL/FixJ family response regulator
MVAIAIVSPDPVLRRRVEELLRGEPGIEIIHVADDATAALTWIEQNHVDAILVDVPAREQPERWRFHPGAASLNLTARELDVLAAMADGASNKVIARRLGVSFHTVKFHVAAILAKLDADTRTEAVTKAAQLGLVML